MRVWLSDDRRAALVRLLRGYFEEHFDEPVSYFLAEGLIDAGTVRCPWHHACFNLKTGEALRAPALSPIACYEVEHSAGKLRVGKKIERDPLALAQPA